MPQMSPFDWLKVIFVSIFVFKMVKTFLFYLKNNSILKNSSKKIFNMIWRW